MKIGVLGLIVSDLADVNYNKIRFAAELGFHGLGAHLTVPAGDIPRHRATAAVSVIADQGLDFLQLWGVYPCIISPDETVRREGVRQAQDIVKLAAHMGVPGAGVRPTSLNPRWEWAPHPDNHKPETEDRLVQSLREILATAGDLDVNIVLEMHQTTTLNTPQTIKRVIERTESNRVRVNLDSVNFISGLQTAFHPAPVIDELFDILGPYVDTVHVKDFYLEERFVVHISETVVGTGMMDLDTLLRRTHQLDPHGYVIIEHLPVGLVPLAKQNLTQKIRDLGLPIG